MVGLVALVVVGVAVILYGALADRARNRRRAAEMMAPPERVIPGLGASAGQPQYVSALQARRPPTTPPTVPQAPNGAGSATVTIRAGYASKDFVNDETGRRAVLDDPYVVVCADAVETVRELLPIVEPALREHRALVLVAPALGGDVLDALEVNAIQRLVSVVAVLADEASRRTVAEATGAQPLDRADRQSGYVSTDQFGRTPLWISTRDTSSLTDRDA